MDGSIIKHNGIFRDFFQNLRGILIESHWNKKDDLILIMTSEKRDKTLELSKHCSEDSTLARNEVIMKTTYPVKSVKCDKICSNYSHAWHPSQPASIDKK